MEKIIIIIIVLFEGYNTIIINEIINMNSFNYFQIIF